LFSLHTSATPTSSTLSLHDALPIWEEYARALIRFEGLAAADPDNARAKLDLAETYGGAGMAAKVAHDYAQAARSFEQGVALLSRDRKSTPLNSSHCPIPYALFFFQK